MQQLHQDPRKNFPVGNSPFGNPRVLVSTPMEPLLPMLQVLTPMETKNTRDTPMDRECAYQNTNVDLVNHMKNKLYIKQEVEDGEYKVSKMLW